MTDPAARTGARLFPSWKQRALPPAQTIDGGNTMPEVEMSDDDKFDVLVRLVADITGLGTRDAYTVAAEIAPPGEPMPDDPPDDDAILAAARGLGYEVKDRTRVATKDQLKGTRITLDPSEVLAEVHRRCPRVLSHAMPRLEITAEGFGLLMGSVYVSDDGAQAFFSVRDGANDLWREVGPIDLNAYEDGVKGLQRAAQQAITTFERCICSDFN